MRVTDGWGQAVVQEDVAARSGVKMDQNLHGLFARALEDEPRPPTDELAQAVMARGSTLRRRRRLRVGGIAGGALAAAVVVVNLAGSGQQVAPAPAVAALPVPGATACVPAEDVSIFLDADITAEQRAGLRAMLQADPLVRVFSYESQDQAYQKFTKLWQDSPDFTESVSPSQLPASFRVTLTDSEGDLAFAARFDGKPGIDDVVVDACPAGSGRGTGGEANGPAGSEAAE
ncbi:permease-like cell division protein FtsX [Micromonosporaceae bacterium Da 78-11]